MRKQSTSIMIFQRNKELIPKIPESNETCQLKLPNQEPVELPILLSNDNQKFIDITSLYAKTGYFTYDPGYSCTGSCVSQITSIDGLKGKLTHRGYKIQDLANNCSYLEVCYLLIYGELPCLSEKSKFEETVIDEMSIHENMLQFYKSFEKDSHPMAIMVGMVGALSAFMKETEYFRSEIQRQITAIKIISKIPMIAAMAFRTSKGLPIVYPKKQYGYIENFLRMMFKNNLTKWKCDRKVIDAIEKIFILHADHEQNASTSTVRITASSLANPYACIAAGIAALWGPNHGGANEAVINMLQEIGSPENVPKYVEMLKDKSNNKRLMGFGHRVYKNFDPRAEVVKDMLQNISSLLKNPKGEEQNLINIAMELEKTALNDKYFIDRKLYPNIDFYTGLIYKVIGIPTNMFTVMFAVARSVGWISQLIEFTSEPVIRIGRPRQLYVGQQDREFVEIDKRSDVKRCIEVPKQCDIFELPIL